MERLSNKSPCLSCCADRQIGNPYSWQRDCEMCEKLENWKAAEANRLSAIEDILGEEYDLDRLREALQKQSEYEEFMERWKDAVAIAGAVKEVGADRVAELVEADKAGRCVILSEAMKPMICKPGSTDVYCPKCGNTLSGGWPLSDADDWRKLCQCPKCGQSIDDTRAESALGNTKEANP